MTTYTGSCHCGNVQYEVTGDINEVIACNCSNCGKRGLLLAFMPEEQLTVRTGEERLKDYRFNKKVIGHMVCEDCGVEVFGRGKRQDGTKTVAINVRTFENVDPLSFAQKAVDGKSY